MELCGPCYPQFEASSSGQQGSGTWLSRLPAVSAGVSQLSSGFATLTNRTAQAKDAAVEEGQTWQRRIASLSGHLTGALSNAFSTPESATAQGIVVGAEVQRALRMGAAVVALESTIISHGMPFPQNLETARAVESVIREQGAVPATIAILDGVPHIGLTDEQLHSLASQAGRVRKTSRRDLAYVMARRLHGATTVSATMLLAARAGIHIFVTGGIGGVHRGAESTMDVSADLTELGRTPVAVVCAGAKSILDIPRTLEYLETQGVSVAAYGTDEFPAFFTRRSGCRAPMRIDTPEEGAELIRAALQLNLDSGIVIGVPVPEAAAAAGERVERATQQALAEADKRGLAGAAVTPFLLQQIRKLTGGASLDTNIALIKHNAAVGSKIAVALASGAHAGR
ncbi:Pseudouridine-5'-phosphate glycosidase [Coccomyxa sp. Obi]|nr:Pseudouridine-5'-phosphate glycosidase [Coccomyxa sp. Obi]